MRKLFILIVCISFFVISFLSAKKESLTYDEIVDFQEGVIILKDRKIATFDTNNPPFIRELASFPYIFEDKDNLFKNISVKILMPARLVIILLSIVLLYSVYLTVKTYFGFNAALFSVFLFAFEPNILANNHYFTLDLGLTLFFFISYLFFLNFLKKPILKNSFFLGILLGLAFASKITALFYFFIIIPILIFLNFKKNGINWILSSKKYIFFILILSFLAVWGTYFFKSDIIIAKRDDPNRVSNKLLKYSKDSNNKVLKTAIYFAKNQKVPLGNYIASVKNSLIRNRQKKEVFFLGKSYSNNRWYFLTINFFLKTPIPLLVFVFISLGIFLKRCLKIKNYLNFLLPGVVILVLSSLINMDPWIRYILPMYPFLIIIASYSIKFFNKSYLKLIFIVLSIWYAYGTLSYYPHFISYANELNGSRNSHYLRFIDSNIDWGQSLPDIKKYADFSRADELKFSYFGRDNGDNYSLRSDFPYGSHKFEDICRFHDIRFSNKTKLKITAISISNWYYCGYYKNEKYSKEKIKDTVGNSILIFN